MNTNGQEELLIIRQDSRYMKKEMIKISVKGLKPYYWYLLDNIL